MVMEMKITVTGDITVDWIQWPVRQDSEGSMFNWKTHLGFKRRALEGGALLTARMLKNLADVNHPSLSCRPEKTDPSEFIHSFAELKPSGDGYHVKRFMGYTGPDEGLPSMPFKFRDQDADIVVIDDAGNGFREMKERWPSAIIDGDPTTVLKMSSPLFSGSLWEHLLERQRENLLLIITMEDLREYGANISRRLSWERTAEDFMWQMRNNPTLKDIQDLRMIVRVGLEGAIYHDGDDARLFYHPQIFEGNLIERAPGKMQGCGCAFTAGLTASLSRGLEIDDSVRRGMAAASELLSIGFSEEPDYPVSDIFHSGGENIGAVDIPLRPKGFWTIADSPPLFDIEAVSRYIVINGYRRRKCPLPVAHFGKLITADRREIEGYQSIRNLLMEYMKNENPERPLCIGVFGPPGAGKSFAVSQLAASVDPERIKPLNFNISQFRDEDDLIDAFHQIRDVVLEGMVPQAFFDEFDSPMMGKRLGWIRYFLAPMQDGEFREGDSMHPLGKSILVFAGGTSSTFQEFESQDPEILREAKVRDFISRLRGYVNIIGPDPQHRRDKFFMLRRAILLRSMFERKTPHLFDGDGRLRIDDGVLDAFLRIPEYRHGVRSMEAILEMSMLQDVKKFEKASLPSAGQLDLHVDGELFQRMVMKN